MVITEVQAFILQTPELYSAPSGAEEAHGIGYLSLIKVTTDSGLVGWSDVESNPYVIKAIIDAPPTGLSMMEGLRSVVVGQNPLDTAALWERMYIATSYYGRRGAAIQAMSGIDIACWDIKGKAQGTPVHELLSAGMGEGEKGSERPSAPAHPFTHSPIHAVRAYASTLFRPTPADMREACLRYLDAGFTAIKFGWGDFGANADNDEARVAAARETVGDVVDLLIDPGWLIKRTAEDAVGMIQRLEPYNPFWFEDFMHPEDYDGYAKVADAVETPVAAGEQESTIWGFRTLAESGHVDILQPDISRCGGLTVARQIAQLAEQLGRRCVPHAWMTDLLTAATLHLNAIMPNPVFVEFNVTRSPLVRELVRNPLKLQDGCLQVPDGPGLGVEIDGEAVARYRVA